MNGGTSVCILTDRPEKASLILSICLRMIPFVRYYRFKETDWPNTMGENREDRVLKQLLRGFLDLNKKVERLTTGRDQGGDAAHLKGASF